MVLDELDARLHPRLTRAIVSLFHGDSNPNSAQLIGATHDTNLLDRRLLRRDQIWFVEKDRRGASRLYSLAELEPPEGQAALGTQYERDYLLGKYGAVPVIGELVKPEPAKHATKLLASYGGKHNPEKDNPSTRVHVPVEPLRAAAAHQR